MSGHRTGIHRHGTGWRAHVSQGKGRPPIRKTFPLETPLADIQAWRLDEAARVRLRRRRAPGTFASDVRRYLAAVKGLTTYSDREREIALWSKLFGHRRRETITAAEIRAIRDHWLASPRNETDERPVAAGTVNKRLRALSNLWRVLDGPRSENPVRDVQEAREPSPVPRDLDLETVERILASLPDRARRRKGQTAGTVSLTKLRLRVLAYTGWPASQLMRLTPADLDLTQGLVTLPGRQKGKGTEAVVLPLLPQAVAALTALVAAKGLGTFDTSAMHSTFARAARRAGVTGASPYSLRHSFATIAYDLTGDDAFVQALLQSSMTRYRMRAAVRVMARKMATLSQGFGITSGITSAGKDGRTGQKPAEPEPLGSPTIEAPTSTIH